MIVGYMLKYINKKNKNKNTYINKSIIKKSATIALKWIKSNFPNDIKKL